MFFDGSKIPTTVLSRIPNGSFIQNLVPIGQAVSEEKSFEKLLLTMDNDRRQVMAIAYMALGQVSYKIIKIKIIWPFYFSHYTIFHYLKTNEKWGVASSHDVKHCTKELTKCTFVPKYFWGYFMTFGQTDRHCDVWKKMGIYIPSSFAGLIQLR